MLGFRFYADPVTASDGVVKNIVDALSSKDSFRRFRGFKSCGGFHPDWCLVWNDGQKWNAAMFCLGCGDLQVFSGDKLVLYCDIQAEEQFKQLLTPLRTNRPIEKLD